MAAKKGLYQIPFDPNGNQQDYPSDTGWNPRIPPTWVDNFEFVDTLTYVHYTQGRSSIGFTFKRTDGTTARRTSYPSAPGGLIVGLTDETK